MLDSLVLTKRIYRIKRIKRIKRRCDSHNKRQSKNNHILIHARPSSNACHRNIFIWTIPRPSWEWIATTLSTPATYLSWNCYSKRFTTYSSSNSSHITNKHPCTTKSKSVLQYNTKPTRPKYSLKYIFTKNQHTTAVQSMDAITKETIRTHYMLHTHLLLTSIQAPLLPLPLYRKDVANHLHALKRLPAKWTSPKPQRSKINNRKYDHLSSKFDTKTSHMIAVANNDNVVQCNNLRSQTILHILSKTQTDLQKQLSNVLAHTSQPRQNTNNPTSIFIIKLHNKKAIYQPSDTNNQTVSILLDIYTKTHHNLPTSCRLSFANKTVCMNTPLSYYNKKYSMLVFDIILPILGGMTQVNTTILQSPPIEPLLTPPIHHQYPNQDGIYPMPTQEN